jgi:adenylate cyclase
MTAEETDGGDPATIFQASVASRRRRREFGREHAAERVAAAMARGDLIEAYDAATAALAQGEESETIKHMQVLALARMGDTQRAMELYLAHNLDRSRDPHKRAAGARLLKDKALDDRSAADLNAAYRAYRAIFAQSQDPYPGINAATLALLTGETSEAQWIATNILTSDAVASPRTYYDAATRGEALLLLGRRDEALEAFRLAVSLDGADYGARATTVRQLKLILGKQGADPDTCEALLAPLRPPATFHYCGHMFAPHPAEESRIRQQVEAFLDGKSAAVGFGMVRAGADVLVAEAVLARGGELHVVLPCKEDDFIAHSVRPAGEAWLARYRACMEQATSIVFASEMDMIGDPEQFGYANAVAMGLAKLRAENLQSRAHQLAVWDGSETSVGGTAADVALWRSRGGATHIIDPGAVYRGFERPALSAHSEHARQLAAILFTDFVGFSKLTETTLPDFEKQVFGLVAKVLDGKGPSVLSRNTWGDALYAVVEGATVGAEIALELQEALAGVDYQALGIDEGHRGMRIALHYGPVYRATDPVTGQPTFFGTEVTRAARIEPVAPPGAVFVTEPFAAMIALEAPERFPCRYVGRIALAKNYGTYPMYRLSGAAAATLIDPPAFNRLSGERGSELDDHDKPLLFVSHHNSKLPVAEHIERALAAKGVRCFITERDAPEGVPKDRAARDAIGQSTALLLLFCSRADASRGVKREAALARAIGKPIIPLRLERAPPVELGVDIPEQSWIEWLDQKEVVERIAARAWELKQGDGSDEPEADDDVAADEQDADIVEEADPDLDDEVIPIISLDKDAAPASAVANDDGVEFGDDEPDYLPVDPPAPDAGAPQLDKFVAEIVERTQIPVREPTPAPSGAAAAPPPPVSPNGIKTGDILNNIFEVTRFIARGGMGEVFEGRNVNSDERVAIKVILPHLAADQNVREMFRKEARTLTRLQHEALVQYRVLAEEPNLGVLYIVTDFIDGANLADVLPTLKPTNKQLKELMRKLAQGLKAAHDLGAIHRDMSPDNVILEGGDLSRPKIIDFGIAKNLDPDSSTIVGDGFAGKLNFVAPEQLGDFDREIGPWTDVYSLALVILAVASGKTVPMGGTLVNAVEQRRIGPDISAAPDEMKQLLSAMLRPHPRDRIRDMDMVLATLDRQPTIFAPAGTGGGAPAPPRKPPKTPRFNRPRLPGGGGPRLPAMPALSSRQMAIGGGGAAALLLGLVIWWAWPDGASRQSVNQNGGLAQIERPAPAGDFNAAVQQAVAGVPCSWLDILPAGGGEGSRRVLLRGVALSEQGLERELTRRLADQGFPNVEIDTAGVGVIEGVACPALDALRPFKARGRSLLTAPETDIQVRENVLTEVGLTLPPDQRDFFLVSIDQNGTATAGSISSRAALEERYREEQARGLTFVTRTSAGYKLRLGSLEPGWHGVVMIVTDDVAQDVFPGPPGLPQDSQAWQTQIPAIARRENWAVHIRWVRGT